MTQAEADPIAQGIEEQLASLLEILEVSEKAILVEMIRKAKFNESGPKIIDEIAIVREFLKAELSPKGFKFDIPRELPPVIKDYEGSPVVPFPTSILDHPLADVIQKRKSMRDFRREALSLETLSKLLNTAYGIKGHIQAYQQKKFPTRYVPSSGGLQPVEVYVFLNDVTGVEPGLYHFHPEKHQLQQIDAGLMRRKLVKACVFQDWIGEAPVMLALTCDLNKLMWKYRRRAYKMAHIDVGIVAENLHLTAQAMGLGSCMLAGFNEDEMHKILNVDGEFEFVALMMAVGRPAG